MSAVAAADGASSKPGLRVAVVPRADAADGFKSPRTPRFAEATSVYSPIEPGARPPVTAQDSDEDLSSHYHPQPQPGDIGFGYIGAKPDRSSGVEMPASPRSPLKSALKSPGAPPRNLETVLSPTFKEEVRLEREEKKTEKQQAKDLAQKVRVRMAKIMLRGTNFSCSLIVVSMLAASFSIFNATRQLPPRNNLPAWSGNTIAWPQITLLVIAAVSLAASVLVFYGYWKGGHRRAEKAAVYYSTFAVIWFIFSIVMWVIGAIVLQASRNNSQGQDMWGWSCADNQRKQLFASDVQYDLVCRMQNWTLVCAIIEIVVELLTILIYSVVFYRYYSKRKLRKSMAARDRARSDLYLATLRAQSAPNTPGVASPRFGMPLSPREGGYNPMYSPRFANAAQEKAQQQASIDQLSAAEQGVRYVTAPAAGHPTAPKPFTLQAPPVKNTTPKSQQSGFSPTAQQSLQSFSRPQTPAQAQQATQAHFVNARQVQVPSSPAPIPPSPGMALHTPAAPGEKQYDAVPIPGAFGSPMASPAFASPGASQFFGSMPAPTSYQPPSKPQSSAGQP